MTYQYECFGEIFDVEVRPGTYGNGQLALELVTRLGEPITKITVHIPEIRLEDGEVAVKTWSENEGMELFLMANDIATNTTKRFKAGFCYGHVMKLTDRVRRELGV